MAQVQSLQRFISVDFILVPKTQFGGKNPSLSLFDEVDCFNLMSASQQVGKLQTTEKRIINLLQ